MKSVESLLMCPTSLRLTNGKKAVSCGVKTVLCLPVETIVANVPVVASLGIEPVAFFLRGGRHGVSLSAVGGSSSDDIDLDDTRPTRKYTT